MAPDGTEDRRETNGKPWRKRGETPQPECSPAGPIRKTRIVRNVERDAGQEGKPWPGTPYGEPDAADQSSEIGRCPPGKAIQRCQEDALEFDVPGRQEIDRKSTRLNSSHANISYAVFCLKKKK